MKNHLKLTARHTQSPRITLPFDHLAPSAVVWLRGPDHETRKLLSERLIHIPEEIGTEWSRFVVVKTIEDSMVFRATDGTPYERSIRIVVWRSAWPHLSVTFLSLPPPARSL